MKVFSEPGGLPSRPARRGTAARLRFEPLEDRLTPVAGVTTSTELLAVTQSAQPLTDLQNVVAAFGLSSSVDLSRSGVVLSAGTTSLLQIGLTPLANKPALQQRLLDTGLYASVSPNYVYSSDVGELRERVPNDPQFGQQYYHTIIQTPAAWDKTVGTSTVVVAILDDGVSISHPDLRNTVWTNAAEVAGDGVDNDGNGFTDDVNGWNFVGNNNNVNPTDPVADDHGTEVAGALAAQIDNAAGIAGVAGGVRFMPLKVVGTGGSTTSLTLARAISYAVQNGAKIINTSINVDPFVDDPTFTAAVSLAYDRGLLLVNSAGNTNTNNPARVKIEEALFVAASDRNDVKTAYSNYGSGIDITAPGGTADDGLLTTIPVSGYAPAFGTSMATPLVAGVAALVWSANPAYSRDQVAAAVLATADSLLAKNPNYEDQLGAGRLNAARAVSGGKIVTGLGKLTGLPAEGADAPPTLGSFNLRLKSPLDAATVTASNFELRYAGADNTFGTADDELIPFEINDGRDYKIGTNDLSFAVNRTLARGLYRFTAKSGGLRDPFGTAVDGDGNGTAGGDLVRNFGVAYQVGGYVYEDTQNRGYPAATDPRLAGVQVFADLNGNGQLDRQSFSTSAFQALPNPAGGPTLVPVTVSGLSAAVNGLRVSVQLSYPQLSALTITLIAPDGTRAVLLGRRSDLRAPGPATSILTFQDGVAESVNDLGTAITYNLQPDDPLSVFNGHAAAGTWTLEIAGATAGGSFSAVGLTVTAEPVAVSDANGFFAFGPLPAGQYFVSVVGGAFAFAAGAGPVLVDTTAPSVPPLSLGLRQAAGVAGRVRAAGGAVVPPTTVFIDGNRDGVLNDGEPTATTDADGLYRFPGLPAGSYAVGVQAPPGYHFTDAGAARQSVSLTADAPVAAGVDFGLLKNTAPVVVSITPVPALLNRAVNSVDFTLSEPLPGLSLADLTLSRDGQLLSLAGATLIGSGTRYSVLGLGARTADVGTYSFGVTAPAPAGEPARKPAFASITWANDPNAPTIRLDGIFQNNGLVGVAITANKPITGLDVGDFAAFDANDRPVFIGTATLDPAGDGRSAVLHLPAAVAALSYVRIQLDGATSGIRDAAGNAYADETGLSFARPSSPIDQPGTPAVRRTVLGADVGSPPTVRVLDATGQVVKTITAFEPGFTGGVRVAAGDVTGDGVDDVIAVAGPGGGPRVRILDGATFAVVAEFMAFEDTFTGGLFVSVGDVTGDGAPDVVLSPDVGGGPRVRILDGRTLATVADFFGIADDAFRGGARTAVGDLNGDGTPDLLVAAGFGGGPRVAGYDGRTLGTDPQKLFSDFFAFDPGLRNGVYLSAGLFDGDRFADLVIGAGPGGGPRVTILSGAALMADVETPIADFFSGDPANRGGVRVAAKPRVGGAGSDLFTADGLGAANHVREYAGQTIAQATPIVLTDFDAFENLFGAFTGVFVG